MLIRIGCRIDTHFAEVLAPLGIHGRKAWLRLMEGYFPTTELILEAFRNWSEDPDVVPYEAKQKFKEARVRAAA